MRPLPQRIVRGARRAATSVSVRLALYAVIALAASWRPLSSAGALNDFRDAHLLQNYEDVAATTVLEYGQAPLWNPWACGGMYALGNPQTRVGAPTVLLSALMDARRAEPFLLFLFLIAGMEGAFRYGRLRSRDVLGPFLLAPMFALSGYIAIAWTLGWINFFGFLLFPWLLYGTARAAEGRLSGVAWVAAGFALMMGFGGTYPVPLCAVFVVLEAVRSLLSKRIRGDRTRLVRAVAFLGAAGLFTLAACAYRLWPILDVMESAPRVMAGKPLHGIPEILSMTLVLAPLPGDKQGTIGIFFVGPAALLLALAAVRSRRAVAPTVFLGLTVWLATGYAIGFSVFAALRALPVFETLRYPERFLLLGGVYLVELAGIAFAVLRARQRWTPRGQWLAAGFVLIGVAGMAMSIWNFHRISLRAELRARPAMVEQPFAQARGNRWAQSYFVAMNRGSISCGEAYPVPMSDRLRGDLPAEEYLADSSAGTARRVSWSPNRIVVAAEVSRPTELLINQNWHSGWRSNLGQVENRDGLLAVPLPQGAHEVELTFEPKSATGGAIVTVLSFAVLSALGLYARRRDRLHWGVVVAGSLVPLVAWAVVDSAIEERRLPAVLRNPNGTPIVVSELPEGARPLQAQLPDVNVQLLGAHVPPAPDEDGLLALELFWKATGPVPRSVGVFVHLIAPDGSFKVADHDVISGTYFFKDAPRDVLLRDAFGVSTGDYKSGTWKVVAGLWHAHGDGSRVEVRDPVGNPLPHNRVEVGEFTVPPKPDDDAGTPDAGE